MGNGDFECSVDPTNLFWGGKRRACALSWTSPFKTLFPNKCSVIFLVESIEGWSKKQDTTSKQSVRSSDKSEWTIEAKLVTGKYISRGERDVIRLRNPTEDKRAFRRMLTSADHSPDILLTSLFPGSLFRVLSLPGAAGRVTLGIPAGLLSPYTRTKSLSDMGIPLSYYVSVLAIPR